MTYKQAFDKITEAYIKGEIKPLNSKFCFCGNLCNNDSGWRQDEGEVRKRKGYQYSREEFERMEWPLLGVYYDERSNTNIEEYLFRAMCKSLDILKQIHKERGEDVDEEIFTKRELCQTY